MFKVEQGVLKWGDSEYLLPQHLQFEKVDKVFGTATAGLHRMRGRLIDRTGDTGRVSLIGNEERAGQLITGDTAKPGDTVFLREQFDPANPNKAYFIISSLEILNDLNWINVKFNNGQTLRLCPFTKNYSICS